MTNRPAGGTRPDPLTRGRRLELVTMGWNIVGVIVLAFAAVAARSAALVGFGVDSAIEIGASAIVLWELSGIPRARQDRALRMIGRAFVALAAYLAVQSTVDLVSGFKPHDSPVGVAWTAATAVAMFALAAGKARVGRDLGNPVISAEGRVTMIDGILAAAVLTGLMMNSLFGWWWADPAAGYVILLYAVREARESRRHGPDGEAIAR